MTEQAPPDIDALLDATWPPAEQLRLGPLTLRRSKGGGQRVQAASADAGATVGDADLDAAIARMQGWGQRPLFRVTESDATPGGSLATRLRRRGFATRDPTVMCHGPLAPLTARDLPRLAAFDLWPPLAVMAEIWADAGIGPDRLAVMERVRAPCSGFMARADNHPAGCAFAALAGDTAVVHALEIRASARRHGAGTHLMIAAARWAATRGASRIAVLVTRANTTARGFYAALGMTEGGGYHYLAPTGGSDD